LGVYGADPPYRYRQAKKGATRRTGATTMSNIATTSRKWNRCAAAMAPCGTRKVSAGPGCDGTNAGGAGAFVQPPSHASAAQTLKAQQRRHAEGQTHRGLGEVGSSARLALSPQRRAATLRRERES